jgi:hypothetical protein
MLSACGDDDDSTTTSPTTPLEPPACVSPPAPVKPASTCDATIALPPIQNSRHVPEGTAISYCTNPPSSGPHYPVWAAYEEFGKPVDAPYLVHSLEHGAVILYYRCETECPEIVAELRRLRDTMPVDPSCTDFRTRSRVILAPSPTLPTKVAAVAWGAVYTAGCAEASTLEPFMREHYAKGPEDLCAPGRSF